MSDERKTKVRRRGSSKCDPLDRRDAKTHMQHSAAIDMGLQQIQAAGTPADRKGHLIAELPKRHKTRDKK